MRYIQTFRHDFYLCVFVKAKGNYVVVFLKKMAFHIYANKHYVSSGWKAVQWRLYTRAQIVSFRNMDISSCDNVGSRCAKGSAEVERNVRNWVNRDIGDGHKLSDLLALRKQKSEIGRSCEHGNELYSSLYFV